MTNSANETQQHAMDNVIELNCKTTLDVHPDKVLSKALGELKLAIVIGYDNSGDEYFASSGSDKAELLWLAERFKLMLLET